MLLVLSEASVFTNPESNSMGGAMKYILSIFLICFLQGIALTDQCAYVNRQQAELAAALLQIHPNYISFCKPCNDVAMQTVHVNAVIAKAIADKDWGVFVNDENVDLAYAFLDIGEPQAINLAMLTGCPATDTPGFIDSAGTDSPKEDIVAQANQYFQYSEFAAAAQLFERALKSDPDRKRELLPQIVKCYYNLGVFALRKKDCDIAADYFRQVRFIDELDVPGKEGLGIARQCQKDGFNSVLKQVAFLELRK